MLFFLFILFVPLLAFVLLQRVRMDGVYGGCRFMIPARDILCILALFSLLVCRSSLHGVV
jgi:hypothetical protein